MERAIILTQYNIMIINELAKLVGIERTRFQSNCKVKIDKGFKNPLARLIHGFSIEQVI
tara:strand:+ start:1599 stop:1775 length:177 start_codon:yes stop_codon:yes gene_type:complete